MKKKEPRPGGSRIFRLDGSGARLGERESVEELDSGDVIYDSIELTAEEGGEVLELYDIGAVVGENRVKDRSNQPPPAGLNLAQPSPPSGEQPEYDGVIDGNMTVVDGGRALMLARHAQTKGFMMPVQEATPEIPASAFAPDILAFTDPNHEALSQFRQLKIQVEKFIDELQYRSIAITSTRDGEGKTSTALNLAIVMSENPWLKLALLDLNFRDPEVGRLMRVPEGDPGLLHVLTGRASFDSALKKLEHRNLYFLHTGGQYDASINILNSPQFDVFLDRLYEAFDLVIIDCPAVVGCDDTLIIKQKVDGVFLVLQAESTPVSELNKAATRLGRDRILGVVLNRVRDVEVA